MSDVESSTVSDVESSTVSDVESSTVSDVEPSTVSDVEPSTGRPGPTVTGDPDLDGALAALADIEEEPLGRHIEAGEAVHRMLQRRLGGLDGA